MEDIDRQILAEFEKLSEEKKIEFILSIPELLARFEAEQAGKASDLCLVS